MGDITCVHHVSHFDRQGVLLLFVGHFFCNHIFHRCFSFIMPFYTPSFCANHLEQSQFGLYPCSPFQTITTRPATHKYGMLSVSCHRDPMNIKCSFCHANCMTRTSTHPDAITITLIIVIIFIFWPLFWLPLVIPGCKTTVHHCSSCNQKVGSCNACSS
jgi:hypothetical protein